MEMTSNCDVTDGAHQIQMTTIWPWTNPPMKIFCVRHCVRLFLPFIFEPLQLLQSTSEKS